MKRSKPLRRTPFKPRACTDGLGQARLTVPIIKPKTCAKGKGGCGSRFTPARPMQAACGPECARAMGTKATAKKAAQAQADDRRQTRAQLEARKTIPELKKEAQAAFNAYVRARDRAAGRTCICCGQPLAWDVPGGAVDCGHYRSTGSADHLRFHEDNAHAQRTICNRHGAGRAVDYRIGLIRRIGLARVEALEAHATTTKWTREGLRDIRDTYRAKARELEKAARAARELEPA